MANEQSASHPRRPSTKCKDDEGAYLKRSGFPPSISNDFTEVTWLLRLPMRLMQEAGKFFLFFVILINKEPHTVELNCISVCQTTRSDSACFG